MRCYAQINTETLIVLVSRYGHSCGMDLERIKQLNLRLLFATQGGREAVAARAGYEGTNYVNQLATGHSPLGKRTVSKFENAFALSSTWFTTPHPDAWLQHLEGVDDEVTPLIGDNISSGPALLDNRVPEISWVAASGWSAASDPYEPGVSMNWHSTTKPHSKSTYALRVKGDSMVNSKNIPPTYFDGQVILVDPELAGDCVSGDRVIALLKDESLPHEHQVTFKQLVIDGGDRFLRPLNTDGSFRTIREDFEIIGKVIAVIGE